MTRGTLKIGTNQPTNQPTIIAINNKDKKNIKHGYISSFKCFEGENIYNIILLENFPCNNKNELLKREGYYIKNLDCVNKNYQ